jgi:spore maturation protein CgeB
MVEPGPNFSVADVHRGWSKALTAAGCEVVNANFAARLEWYERACKGMGGSTEEGVHLTNESLRATVYDLWPELIVITSSFYVSNYTLDVLRSRGHKVVLLHTESPYEDDRQIERAERADFNVVNDPTNIDAFPPGTVYLPHAYDSEIHYPADGYDNDFVMVGTGYPSRVEFLESVDWPCKPVLCGNWQGIDDDSPLIPFLGHDRDECFPNEEAANLYRGAKSSLNLYRKEATHVDLVEGWAMGPREVELAACGTFYLTEARGENRDVLPMVPTVEGPDDFSEKLAWWLDHDTERDQVASQAQAAVADRTFHQNARRLLELVG